MTMFTLTGPFYVGIFGDAGMAYDLDGKNLKLFDPAMGYSLSVALCGENLQKISVHSTMPESYVDCIGTLPL
jgi:hypothetical protein